MKPRRRRVDPAAESTALLALEDVAREARQVFAGTWSVGRAEVDRAWLAAVQAVLLDLASGRISRSPVCVLGGCLKEAFIQAASMGDCDLGGPGGGLAINSPWYWEEAAAAVRRRWSELTGKGPS